MGTYEDLKSLGQEFWEWRSINQPITGDDIPRIERPDGWVPNWSKHFINENLEQLKVFQQRFAVFQTDSWTVSQQVDHALVGCAMARAHWEYLVTANWRRNPCFYIDQSVGSIFDELVVPAGPEGFDDKRARSIIQKLQNFRAMIDAAMENLDQAVKSFAELALQDLKTMGQKLLETSQALQPLIPKGYQGELIQATVDAVAALNDYQTYLKRSKDRMLDAVALGKEQYEYFLRDVAVIPWDADRILQMAKQTLQHCISQEAIEGHSAKEVPEPPVATSAADQMKRNAEWDAKVRQFLKDRKLLTIPDWLKAYRNDPIPAYLAPIASWGCLNDLTSASRLNEDARRYIPEPSPTIGFFQAWAARDPRPVLVHEGIPGHYCQLAMSWAHPNVLRRHFYDSTPNEGIGFYAEELLLQQGFFDDSPHTRRTLYKYMRLRAIRVEVDVKLATGQFTIDEAADYLVRNVPMDRETALWEAVFFASIPGQALSYTVGKLQLFKFMSTARVRLGDKFDLQHWHDFVWLNGNVPIALMQKEYLGGDGL